MKPHFLLSFLCLASIAFSQDSTFQLKDYKYRTPGFQALSLYMDVSGSYSKNEGSTVAKNKASGFNAGPFSLSYYRTKSTNNVWEQLTATTLGVYGSSSNSDSLNNQYSNYKSFQNYSTVDWDRRLYKSSGWFFELGGSLKTQLNNAKQKAPSPYSRQSQFSGEGNLTVGFGKGRVEWVRDAQTALYILNDLSAQGLLDVKPTAQMANAFAQLITDIRNKRVFDSRRRLIYELTRIDSFLRRSGLAAQTDIRHFTTVNDNWLFAVNPFRSSGSFWYVRVKPGMGYNRWFGDYADQVPRYTTETITTYPMVSPVAGYERYKPVSLKWQHNMGVSLAYIYTANHLRQRFVQGTNTTTTKGSGESHDVQFHGFYGLGFFPNSRTQLTTTVDVTASRSNLYDEYHVMPAVRFSTDYFLGYQTFLSASFEAWYNYSNYLNVLAKREDRKTLSSNFSFRFTHYLF